MLPTSLAGSCSARALDLNHTRTAHGTVLGPHRFPQAVFAPSPALLAALGYCSLHTEYKQELVPLFVKVQQGSALIPSLIK